MNTTVKTVIKNKIILFIFSSYIMVILKDVAQQVELKLKCFNT